MPYIVKEGKKLIYGDEDGVHHRYKAGEIVEGVEHGELDKCRAVEWITDKMFEALADSDPRHKSNRELRELCDEADPPIETTLRMNKDELIALLEGGGE